MLEFLQRAGRMSDGGVGDDRGMVNDVEGVRSLGRREFNFHEGWDLCLCGSGGGVDGSSGSSGVDGSVVYRSSGGGLFMSV